VFDALYADQAVWSWNGKVQATVAKVLSPADFQELQQQVQDPSINEMLKREIALGRKREVNLTPTFFVTALGKEQKVVGVLPYHILKEFFDRIAK
jgi:protein-disulfide isomerase